MNWWKPGHPRGQDASCPIKANREDDQMLTRKTDQAVKIEACAWTGKTVYYCCDPFLFITGLPDCPAAIDRGNQCHVLPAYEGDPEYESDWGKPYFWIYPWCRQGAEDSPCCAKLAQTKAELWRGTWQHTKGDKYVHHTPSTDCQGSKQWASYFLLSEYEAGGLLVRSCCQSVEISPATKSP